MLITEIYKNYQIMPQLQEHMLRVAGVASVICENFKDEIDRENIVKACLLHDMGNIVKFDFRVFPEIAAGQGLGYWENVKQKFIEKYGTGSHNVTAKILRQIGVGERIFTLADCVGFGQGKDNAESQDFGKKICAYADMRVLPAGVGSLEKRMADLRVRYNHYPEKVPGREVFEAALRQIEKQIFALCKIRPEEITEKSIRERVDKLRDIDIRDCE